MEHHWDNGPEGQATEKSIQKHQKLADPS